MRNFKLIVFFAFLTHFLSFAQVGIGNTNPKATIDVNKSIYTLGEQAGIAVTQLTGNQINTMSTSGLKPGTLVYATSTDGIINSIGFWNYNGSIWVKVGGSGETSTASNGLVLSGTDIQLGGSLNANTSINQGNNSLTFNGTGLTQINTPMLNNNAQYVKVRVITTNNYTVTDDDNVIIYKGDGTCNMTLPNAATNVGRLITIINNDVDNFGPVEFSPGQVAPFMGVMSVQATVGNTLVSDGTYWFFLAQ